MVRDATLEDIPQLVEWGAAMHEASPWASRTYDPDATAQFLDMLITAPHGAVFISDAGMIGGAMAPIFMTGERCAMESFWWARERGWELLKTFEQWARDQGCVGVLMLHMNGDERSERVVKIYERRGYAPRETGYFKELG
jgi:GNAT superfamily N-acetyltransferase